MSTGIERLNGMSADELRSVLQACCGSRRWVAAMLGQFPFDSSDALQAAAAAAWATLSPRDWREAFAASAEQEMPVADESTQAAAAVALRLYHERFGYPFSTDAEDLTADELLMLIRIRLGHDEGAELRRSRVEHERLTRQRLERLLSAQRATP